MASKRENEELLRRAALLQARNAGNPAAGALVLGAQLARQNTAKPAPKSGAGGRLGAPVSSYLTGGQMAAPAAPYAAARQGRAPVRVQAPPVRGTAGPVRVQAPQVARPDPVRLPFVPQGTATQGGGWNRNLPGGLAAELSKNPAQQFHMLSAGVQGLSLDEYSRRQNAAAALPQYNQAHAPRNLREVAFGRVTDAEAKAARDTLAGLYSRPYDVWTQGERAAQLQASDVIRTYVKNQRSLGRQVSELDRQLADMSGRFVNAARSVFHTAVAAAPVLVDTAQQQAQNVAESRQNQTYRTLEEEIAALNTFLRAATPNAPENYYLNGGMTAAQWAQYQQTGVLPAGVPLTVREYDQKRKRLQQAEARRNELAVKTPVSPDTWGSRMMNRGAQQRDNALMGLSGAERFVGNTAIGMADTALTLPLAAISPAAPLAIMGVKAGAQKTNELNGRGFAPGQALGRGLLAGGIEVLTEKMPIDNVLNIVKTGGKGYIKNILKQMGVEATEEAASTVLNHAADVMANDPEAKLSLKDLVLSAAGGALSALGFAGVGTALHSGLNQAASLVPRLTRADGSLGLNDGGHHQPVKNDANLSSDSNYLNESDLGQYILTGKRKSTRDAKLKMMEEGDSPIIVSNKDMTDFITRAINGEQGRIKAFGKVSERLADTVRKHSNGQINIDGRFLEIGLDDIEHSYKEHSLPKQSGDMELTFNDYIKIPEYIADFDDILQIRKGKNAVVFQIGKKINGYSIITEIVSNERDSIRFRNMWRVSTKKYKEKYQKKQI